jgi:hypothetical protein
LEPISYVLLVAYELVMLTFSLGVLILALPIPLRGVKSWSTRMIADSIAAFILLLLYTTIIEISDSLPSLLGWTWEAFYSWYSNALGVVIALKALIASLIAAAKAFYMSQLVSSLIGPVDRLVSLMLLGLVSIWTLASIVRATYQYLIALGIALYSLPFRLGKSAGAWLIAFAAVFNAGLPLLPAFLQQAVGNQPSIPEGMDATFAKVSVEDYNGEYVNSGYIEVYILANGTLTEIARYHISPEGAAIGKYGSGYVSLPASMPSYWVLVLDSVYLPLQPLPLNGTSDLNVTSEGYSATLRSPNLLYQDDYKIVYFSSGELYSLETGDNTVTVTLHLDAGEYVEALAPSGCTIEISYTGDGYISEGSWEWLGISGSYKRYTASSSGDHSLTVTFYGSCQAKPSLPQVEDYALDYLGLTNLSSQTIPALLLSLLLLPTLFIFLLSSIAAALARFLGGREKIIPRL